MTLSSGVAPSAAHRPANARTGPAEPPSLFEARGDGPAERWAAAAEGRSPAIPIALSFAAGWAALSAIFIGIGFLLTKVVLEGSRGAWDERVNRWLADHRTAWLDHVTALATFLANTLPVVVAAAAICGALLVFRQWRPVLFMLWALATEITTFLTVNYVVHRSRPNVLRLDSTPSTGSFPSGHIAASLVLWVGLAVVVTALVSNRLVRGVVWVVAVVEPLTVGFARAYRGMHHVTDVVAGACLGAGCLLVAVAAVRLVGAVVEHRQREHEGNVLDTPVAAAR